MTNNNKPTPPQPESVFWKNPALYMTVALMVLVGVGIFITRKGDIEAKPANASTTVAAQNSRTAATVVAPTPTFDGVFKVYVAGAVKNPGVYQMQSGDRIEDAIKTAGGATENADLLKIDLAKRVTDEMQITVPEHSLTPTIQVTAAVSTIQSSTKPSPTPTDPSGKINVNTATAPELDKLPGIGEVLSARIVDYRTKNGPYNNLDDLRKVTGLTASVIEKIKDLIIF
jgi:competence protein ComEA